MEVNGREGVKDSPQRGYSVEGFPQEKAERGCCWGGFLTFWREVETLFRRENLFLQGGKGKGGLYDYRCIRVMGIGVRGKPRWAREVWGFLMRTLKGDA